MSRLIIAVLGYTEFPIVGTLTTITPIVVLDTYCVEAPIKGEPHAMKWTLVVVGDFIDELEKRFRGVVFETTRVCPIIHNFSVNHIDPSFTKWVLTRIWWTLAELAEMCVYTSSPTLTSILETEYLVA